MNNTAQNVANVTSEGYNPKETAYAVEEAGGVRAETKTSDAVEVDLSKEVVDMIAQQRSFEANIATVKTEDERLESTIDIIS